MNTANYPLVGPNYGLLMRNSSLEEYMKNNTPPEDIMKEAVRKRDLDTLLDLIASGYTATYSEVRDMNASDYSYLTNACEIMDGGLSLSYHEAEMIRIRLYNYGQYYSNEMLEQLSYPVRYKQPRKVTYRPQEPV